MPERGFYLIGELINNSFKRARTAFQTRDLAKYQNLARLQTAGGADYLTVNIDGTQRLDVRFEDMIGFLPDLVPALQEATDLPLAFDNPAAEFHRCALELYRRKAGNQPILNSLAASREELDVMIELVKAFDTKVIVMASERFTDAGGAQCTEPAQVHQTARHFVELLQTRAGRRNEEIIIDPGLAPISADTYGLVNTGLDAMRLIRADPDLEGVHLSVGLTNFSFGVPNEIKEDLENAYITLARDAGLDFILGNPEKNLSALPDGHPALGIVKEALKLGRPNSDETQEDAGFRQAEKIMELFLAEAG